LTILKVMRNTQELINKNPEQNSEQEAFNKKLSAIERRIEKSRADFDKNIIQINLFLTQSEAAWLEENKELIGSFIEKLKKSVSLDDFKIKHVSFRPNSAIIEIQNPAEIMQENIINIYDRCELSNFLVLLVKNKKITSAIIEVFKNFLREESAKKLVVLFSQLKKTNNKEAIDKVLWNLQRLFEDYLQKNSPFDNQFEDIEEEFIRLEKRSDFFEKQYLINEKKTLLDYKSFQLFIIFFIEYMIKKNLYYYYQMPFFRAGYKEKIEFILKDVLGNQKHIGHRRAISELFSIIEKWKEKEYKIPIESYLAIIREFHGLSKNLEVMDLSDIWQTLQKLRTEITFINELYSPAIEVLKDEQELLGEIGTLGVGPNKSELARSIVNSLSENNEDGFRLDAFGIIFSSIERMKDEEKVTKTIENIYVIDEILKPDTKAFKRYATELGDDWDSLIEKLNLLKIPLFLEYKKLQTAFFYAGKESDDSKSKDDEDIKESDIKKVNEIRKLEYYFKKLQSYIEKDLEKQITVAKIFHDEKRKFLVIQKRGKSDMIEAQKKKLLAIQKKYKLILQKANFKKVEKGNGIYVVADTKTISQNTDLVQIRAALVKTINYFYDLEGELVKNIKRLRGEVSKNTATSTIGLIELLNTMWDKKDALLQTKLKFLKSFAQEKDEKIIAEFNEVISALTHAINKDHYINFPFKKTVGYFNNIPKDHLDELKRIIQGLFVEKKASPSATKKFFLEFDFDKDISETSFHNAMRYLEKIHLFTGKESAKEELERIYRDYLTLKEKEQEEKEIIDKAKTFEAPKKNITEEDFTNKDNQK